MASQFKLLKAREFLPYFITQSLGAFNDNLFKNALLLLIAFELARDPAQIALYNNLAAGLFILPFLLFSALAGQVADKVPKPRLIRWLKFTELVLMLLAVIALQQNWLSGLLLILFLMGCQSAFFGPAKFSILPQQLPKSMLLGANALVEMGTFVAILLGTLLAAILFGLDEGLDWVSLGIVGCATVGWLASLSIPGLAASAPSLKINFNPFASWKASASLINHSRITRLSIVAISWFWFVGASILTQIPVMSQQYIGPMPEFVSFMLAAFVTGVAIGSLVCNKLLKGEITTRLMLPCGIALSILLLDIARIGASIEPLAITEDAAWSSFQLSAAHWHLLADMALLAFAAGAFVVPLQACLQHHSEQHMRARMIACNNLYNALFMVGSALFAMLVLGFMAGSIAMLMLLLALGNALVILWAWRQRRLLLLQQVTLA
ncbi:MFS transporter [Paraferrimonas sedimenticola]|uniref:MFS transporter n=1 Tax=Paraferrimonas sedimenticola TaxID=375674 RepID=A0AA37W0I3_9GAMM|nr:MFS transporter [Paraferrimonas sedimenticola]GLP97929.1 hypothetical protein GCM10007895_32360 [Paraferrimonas sedimenticola]